MAKISEIIIPIYNKFLTECEERKVTLNLDLPDPTIQIENAKELKKTLNSLAKAALGRTNKKDSITIGAARSSKDSITVTVKDTGDSLTREEREKLTNETTEIRSRMGYGTTITVKIKA